MQIDYDIRANALVEALPYLQEYNDKVVVVKYGGNAMTNETLKQAVMQDIVLLSLLGTFQLALPCILMIRAAKRNTESASGPIRTWTLPTSRSIRPRQFTNAISGMPDKCRNWISHSPSRHSTSR